MKERPILFSGPMVRAILEGRKSQTRRVVASQMAIEDIERMAICHPILGDAKRVGSMKVDREMVGCMCGGELTETDIVRLWCRHGVPGDRLWVKEKWRPAWHPEMFCSVQYAADSSYHKPTITDETRGHRFADACEQSGDHAEPWHPSIHMWREFSRITLEVVSVRVQRLQEISEEDAITEGVQTHAQVYAREYAKEGIAPPATLHGTVPWYRYDGEPCSAVSARHSFQTLWESINGKGSWSINPWVWVIEFKKVEAANGDH